MKIREEIPSDINKIWKLNSEVFDTDAEANLVDELRSSGCLYLSLVAELENNIIGHILFTPVVLTNFENDLRIMGLAPMAVEKKYQNKGIGTGLVNVGLEHCRNQQVNAVVVLGHPDYYPKFGFVPSVEYGIHSEYEVPEEVFMVLELTSGSLKNRKGTIKYHEAFNSV